MVTDPSKITEARAKSRQYLSPEARQIEALEQIADTLEAIRIEFVGLQHVLGAMVRSQGN